MAIIPQPRLFSWDQVDAASDLDRLQRVLEALPDEALMQAIEAERKGKRDDYPLRAVWNSLVAGVVFQHVSVESLRREMQRNGELRQVCGFDPVLGLKAVPPWVYTRLFHKLMARQADLDAMFDGLVERLGTLLPDLGIHLAVDSKAVDSHGRPTQTPDPDGRRDTDADWGAKTYRGTREDGSVWEKVQRWFGYKTHLIVDAVHELPLSYTVTKASAHDSPHLLPLVDALETRHPEILERAQDFLAADKAYDAEGILRDLYDAHAIKPIIDTRRCWKDEPELPRPLYPERVDTIFYTESGEVVCRRRDDQEREQDNYTPLVFQGFEAERGCLKYRCPAAVKGCPCTQRDLCNGGEHTEHGRIVRIPLDTDRRTFTPLPRHTPSWEKAYDRRTAIERVHRRLDVSFGFERHFVRGLKKMTCRVALALVIMLALAVGWIDAGEPERLRSLVGRRSA